MNKELIKEIIEVLEFYSNEDNYYDYTDYGGGCADPECCVHNTYVPVERDEGLKAKTLLNKIKEIKDE